MVSMTASDDRVPRGPLKGFFRALHADYARAACSNVGGGVGDMSRVVNWQPLCLSLSLSPSISVYIYVYFLHYTLTLLP